MWRDNKRSAKHETSLKAADFDNPRFSVWLRLDLRLGEHFGPLVNEVAGVAGSSPVPPTTLCLRLGVA